MIRSWLFLPGDNDRFAERALSSGADAVIFDLEDAVADERKQDARQRTKKRVLDWPDSGPRAYVRINSLDTGLALEDLEAVVCPGLRGIVVPKVANRDDLLIVDWVIGQLENRAALRTGSVELVPLIEVAAGVTHLPEIAAGSNRTKTLAYGAGDLAADLGMTWEITGSGDVGVRSSLAFHARAAGLVGPIDSVSIDIANEKELKRQARRAKSLGFSGKLCIHPTQVASVNEIFAPSVEEVRWARSVLAAMEVAATSGRGAVRLDGDLIDWATVRSARAILGNEHAPDSTQESDSTPDPAELKL